MTVCQPLPELARVARSFGRAAQQYDQHARLQRDVADRLIAAVDVEHVQCILDAGSGTGYCARQLASRHPEATLINLDIAEPMLAYARQRSAPACQAWVCSDAQAMPFRDNSFDLAVSSLTIQWCPDLATFFAELHRVLLPGGRAWISTLAVNTLQELRASWAAVDGHVHVNRFLPLDVIRAAVESAPFTRIDVHNTAVCYYYESLSALTTELKGIGASNRNPQQPTGLTGKQKLQQLRTAFERGRIAGKGIPATYDLVTIAVEK